MAEYVSLGFLMGDLGWPLSVVKQQPPSAGQRLLGKCKNNLLPPESWFPLSLGLTGTVFLKGFFVLKNNQSIIVLFSFSFQFLPPRKGTRRRSHLSKS